MRVASRSAHSLDAFDRSSRIYLYSIEQPHLVPLAVSHSPRGRPRGKIWNSPRPAAGTLSIFRGTGEIFVETGQSAVISRERGIWNSAGDVVNESRSPSSSTCSILSIENRISSSFEQLRSFSSASLYLVHDFHGSWIIRSLVAEFLAF